MLSLAQFGETTIKAQKKRVVRPKQTFENLCRETPELNVIRNEIMEKLLKTTSPAKKMTRKENCASPGNMLTSDQDANEIN